MAEEDRQALRFRLLAQLTFTEDAARLREVADILETNIDPGIVDRFGLLHGLFGFLMGDDFVQVPDDDALDRLGQCLLLTVPQVQPHIPLHPPVLQEAAPGADAALDPAGQLIHPLQQPQPPQFVAPPAAGAPLAAAGPPAAAVAQFAAGAQPDAAADAAAHLAAAAQLAGAAQPAPIAQHAHLLPPHVPVVAHPQAQPPLVVPHDDVNLGGVAGGPVVRLRRLQDCKIKGTIGMPGEEGKLDYGNLMFQIADNKQKGYDDHEIVSAVVQAIKAGLELRGYLEGVPNLTMETLKKKLRLHFKVKDAANAFRVMERTVQGESEKADTFCQKMFRLRQDVIMLSRLEGDPYTEDYIQTRFQHALYTGLRDQSVRQQLKTMLTTGPVEDDDLLEEINDITMADVEHKEKIAEQKQKEAAAKAVAVAKVNALEKKKKEEDPTQKLLAQVSKLHSEQMDKLTAVTCMLADRLGAGAAISPNPVVPNDGAGARGGQVSQGGRGGHGGRGRNFRPGYCADCTNRNVRYCPHCFICGSGEHSKDECPQNPKNV